MIQYGSNKVFLMGYYYPTMFQDAKKYSRGCDSCQRMGQPIELDEMSLQTQPIINPFEKWDLNILGPISSP